MLSEMVPYILILILSIFSSLTVIFAFKKGYELGVKDWNTAHPDEPKVVEQRKAKTPSSVTDKALKKYETMLENIENYDGTDANQREIK